MRPAPFGHSLLTFPHVLYKQKYLPGYSRVGDNGGVNDHSHESAVCAAFQRAVELIGRRWTGAILFVLRGGPRRFGDIAAAVPGLTDRMLSERLKELEAEGILTRTVYPDMPVRVEYALTERGRALWPVLDAIAAWAHDWSAAEPPAHPAGATPPVRSSRA